jgi:hypothetical protein
MNEEAHELSAIRNTLAAYNLAGDRARVDDLAATFLEDGVLATPTATYRGRTEILAGLGGRVSEAPAAGRRPTLVRHHLTTSAVTLTGPTSAEGRSYFIVFSDIGLDHAGHYVDRLRKVAQAWLFERRDVRVDWIADASLFPALQAAHASRRAEQKP